MLSVNRIGLDTLEWEFLNKAGIQMHLGKTRVWNRKGIKPEGIEVLGDDVWNPNGVMALGTPIGNDHFRAGKVPERIVEETRLWDAIPGVPDLQCAWQILLQSAGPRMNYIVRTMPPSQSATYADIHGGMWKTTWELLGAPTVDDDERILVQGVSTLPMRMGGLSLRSVNRTAPAASWASWADALPMIASRNRAAYEIIHSTLVGDAPAPGCLGNWFQLAKSSPRKAFRTSLLGLISQRDHVPLRENEPGDWPHGWQFHASSFFATKKTHEQRSTN